VTRHRADTRLPLQVFYITAFDVADQVSREFKASFKQSVIMYDGNQIAATKCVSRRSYRNTGRMRGCCCCCAAAADPRTAAASFYPVFTDGIKPPLGHKALKFKTCVPPAARCCCSMCSCRRHRCCCCCWCCWCCWCWC